MNEKNFMKTIKNKISKRERKNLYYKSMQLFPACWGPVTVCLG